MSDRISRLKSSSNDISTNRRRRSPEGETAEKTTSKLSSVSSNDSAFPSSIEIDDNNDNNSRSKSSHGRLSGNDSKSTEIPLVQGQHHTSSSSDDRFRHGIRYITDGLIRKLSKQNNITRIKTLDFSQLRDKKIRYIENLQTLVGLEQLNLNNNLIEKLDGLKTLKNLKEFYIGHNFIKTLTNLEELSKLEVLDVQHNQISEIPAWFAKKLISLKSLNLSNNRIQSFDQIVKLRTLYELKELNLQGNEINQHEHYRLLVISYLPTLNVLDQVKITEEEREQAKEQFVQQEVQNLLHLLERRDNECRRLNMQTSSSEQMLEKTSDKLKRLEHVSSTQVNEIKLLQEKLQASEEELQRKTSLLYQACEKQTELEQELAFYKIDLKFDMIDFSQYLNGNTVRHMNRGLTKDSPYIGKAKVKLNSYALEQEMINDEQQQLASVGHLQNQSMIRIQAKDLNNLIGCQEATLLNRDDNQKYNEKLLELAVKVSELSFLRAKHEIFENRLEIARQSDNPELYEDTIKQLSNDLNLLQNEMMNKISHIQDLQIDLGNMRQDQGSGVGKDVERITKELKLNDVLQQHIDRLKKADLYDRNYEQISKNGTTFEQALNDAISSSGASIHDHSPSITYDDSNELSNRLSLLEYALEANIIEQKQLLKSKLLTEEHARLKIQELEDQLHREQLYSQEKLNKLEQKLNDTTTMAEKEKQRILKHLEDEKRFTRDIISKSEQMIKQLKRELSQERIVKSEQQKTSEALRDIYKKINPEKLKQQRIENNHDQDSRTPLSSYRSSRNIKNDDNSDVDTSLHKSRTNNDSTLDNSVDKTEPPPLLSSTPRDITHNNNEQKVKKAPVFRHLSHSNNTTTTAEFQQELSQLLQRKNDSILSGKSRTLSPPTLKIDRQDDNEQRNGHLPPTPKKCLGLNSSISSLDRLKHQQKHDEQQKTEINPPQFDREQRIDGGMIKEDENNLLYRLHGYYKAGQVYLSEMTTDNDTLPNTDGSNYLSQPLKTANDSGYSSQQTARYVDPFLSTQPFSIQKCFKNIMGNENMIQFNHDYTVGMVRTGDYSNTHHHYQSAQNIAQQPHTGNVTLYPTPEGYMLGPNSVTLQQQHHQRSVNNSEYFHRLTPREQQQHPQFSTSVNIPPEALSSNRTQRSDDIIQLQGPVVFRTDVNNISPISVKLRSLKYPQPEKSTMTDTDSIRREIDRATDEIDYLRTTLHLKEDELHKDSKYLKLADLALTKQDDEIHLLNRTLEQQKLEIERLKGVLQDLLNNGSENEQNVLLNVSEQLQRVQKNIHERLSPALTRIVDNRIPYVQQQEDSIGMQMNGGQFIPIGNTDWLCNIPRHIELEQIINDLQVKLDEYREQLNEIKKDNRHLEKKVVSQDTIIRRSNKIEALDLANQQQLRRAKSAHTSEIETLQDDVFVLEQQLIRKKREVTMAQQQLKNMTKFSQTVLHDLKTAKNRHTITKRETKVLEQKAESLTRKLVKLTDDIRQAEEHYDKIKNDVQISQQEQATLDKNVEEKRALSIVLDEQIRDCYNSFNSLIRTSTQCLTDLSTTNDDNNITSYQSQQYPNISLMSRDDIQRYLTHAVTENNKIMLKHQNMLQKQKQKAQQLKQEIKEKEVHLEQLRQNLDSSNEQLRRSSQELLENKQVLEELEKVKEIKLDKLNECERGYDRKLTQDKQLQQQFEILTSDVQKLKRQQKDSLADYDALRHNIDADQKILNEIKLEAQRLKEQIKVFLDDKETLDETCDLLAKKCEALHNECKEKEKEMNDLNHNIEEKLHVAKSLEEEIKNFKQDKKTIVQEVADMKEKIEKKKADISAEQNSSIQSRSRSMDFELENEEIRQRIKAGEEELLRLNIDIDARNRTLNELNTMVMFAKNIMKNIQPNDNKVNYQSIPHDYNMIDKQQEMQSVNYENKIQRLNKIIDEKDDEIRILNMDLIRTKDELFQLENKQKFQETNFNSIKISMQNEMDKLKHWLEIYENRKSAMKPHYKEALNELELKLHEQEMFYRKQIKDIDLEMKRKHYHSSFNPDDSGFLTDTTTRSGDYHYLRSSTPPTSSDYFNSNNQLRDQIQTIFRQHVDELDKCNIKYKTSLSNLKNRLHELENTTTNVEPVFNTTTY